MNKHLRTAAIFAVIFALIGAWFFWDELPWKSIRYTAVTEEENRENSDESAWPGQRGPNFDGHSVETGLTEHWESEGPPILWRRALGQGYSGFAAQGTRVYTAYQTLAGQYLACLHADTGETIWESRIGWPFEPAGLYPGPRGTPTLADGRVYYAAPDGWLGCFDAKNGASLWSVSAKEKFAGHGTDFGYSCAVTVTQGKVVLPIGGEGASVVAFDAKSGAVVWKSGDDPASYSPILPIKVAGKDQLVAFMQNALIGLDTETGRELWRHPLSHGYDEHATVPIWSEPYLLIAKPFRAGADLLDLRVSPPATVWHSQQMSNDVFSSVLVGDSLLGFDIKDVQAKVHRPSRGEFRCLDFKTGKTRWSTNQTGHTSVTAVDGKLILCNDLGEVMLIKADPDRYVELARAKVLGGKLTWQQPAFHHGRLYLRNHEEALCLFLRSPLELKNRTTPLAHAKISAPPIDLSRLLGIEREYAFDVPDLQAVKRWYFVGLVWIVAPTAIMGSLLRRFGERAAFNIASWAAIISGAVTTIVWGRIYGEVLFTWPVALFSVFHWTIDCLAEAEQKEKRSKGFWRSRIVAAIFLAVCALYYWLCRRLSLAAEWGFLIGFPAAFPILLAEKRKRARIWSPLLIMAAFTAYFWFGYFVIVGKQSLPR